MPSRFKQKQLLIEKETSSYSLPLFGFAVQAEAQIIVALGKVAQFIELMNELINMN